MRYLLDTGIFLWSLDPFEKLNRIAQGILVENKDDLYLSAVSSWEISIKASVGKLQLPGPPQQYVPHRMSTQGFLGLQITHEHALAVSGLPRHHNDPFDRLLIAQARSEGMVLMTADAEFRKYPVEILWCGK
jgi:PIN domain nuclease of toxin-antitoxin system